MLKFIILPISLLVMAQAKPPVMPPPPVVTMTIDDKAVIHEALAKLGTYLGTINDYNTAIRLRGIEHGVAFMDTVDPTSLPIIGMALSRNSKDPRACALLQRIEPSAVCMK